MIFDKYDLFDREDNVIKNSEINTQLIFENCTEKSYKYSIIIPTYKRPNIIRETLLSALEQKFSGKYEVLLNSDGVASEELETEKIVKDLAKTYVDMSYYRNEKNLGMFGNWNRCIKLAKGEWIIVLPDDDILSPNYLKTVDDFIINHSYQGMIGVGYKKILGNTKYCEMTFKEESSSLKTSTITCESIYMGNSINVTGMAFPKQFIESIGGFQEKYYPVSDTVCIVNFAHFYKVTNLSYELAAYRVDNNISLTNGTMDKIILFVFQMRNRLAKNNGLLKLFNWKYKYQYIYGYMTGAETTWDITLDKNRLLSEMGYRKNWVISKNYFFRFWLKLMTAKFKV